MKSKKVLALVLVLVLAASSFITTMAVPTTNPEGGDLETIMDFESLTDTSKLTIDDGDFKSGTDYKFELQNSDGESGKSARYTNLNATSGTSAFISVDFDLEKLGIKKDWSKANELWLWQKNDFASFAGTYFFVQLITNDDKVFVIKNGDAFKHGSQSGTWITGNTAYGIYTQVPTNAANWVRLPFANFKDSSASDGGVITQEQLKTIKAIKLMVPVNAFFPNQGITFDSFGLFTADPEVVETDPKVPFKNTPCNDAFIKADSTITETKVLIGGEEFANGTQLGVSASEPIGFLADNMAGTFYDFAVKNDGKGSEGQYFEFLAKDVPSFNYTNQIFQLVKYDKPPTDWTSYNEMMVWVDVTGFGPQYEGTDFSIQAYECDYDGDTKLDTFERWAVQKDKTVYVQSGNSWKAVKAHADMMIRIEKNFKGWIRVPFDSMSLVEILGIGNRTFDKKEILSIVTGIPSDANRTGYSMKMDSVMLAKTNGAPAGDPQDIDLTPRFDDDIANIVDPNPIMLAIKNGVTDISVNVRNVSEVSGDVFAAMMDKDVNLKINVYDESLLQYSIKLNGKNITGDSVADLTAKISENAENAQAALSKVESEEKDAFSIAENDPFPGKISYVFPTEFSGKVSLSKYDPDLDKLTKISEGNTVENDMVSLEIESSGTYVVTADSVEISEEPTKQPATGETSRVGLFTLLMLVSMGAIIMLRRQVKA